MILFIHGLNTFGDDDLHVGPFTHGKMHRHLEDSFRKRGIPFAAITGLGAGSPEEQADRAEKFIQANLTLPNRIHLLGQSTGGLVARVLATRLVPSVRTIMTMGTPHAGTLAADFGIEFANRYPRLQKIFSVFGYDTNAKLEIFRHFTTQALAEFNSRYPARAGIKEITLLCEVTRKQLSWPLQVFYRRLHPILRHDTGGLPPSDGFILSESQRRGEVLGPFALDHFGELGFFFQMTTNARNHAASEFERMVEVIATHVSPISNQDE